MTHQAHRGPRVRGAPPGISPAAFERLRAEVAEREKSAPKVGAVAPDFELPLLGDGERRVRLSSLRGRPVALYFGSYT